MVCGNCQRCKFLLLSFFFKFVQPAENKSITKSTTQSEKRGKYFILKILISPTVFLQELPLLVLDQLSANSQLRRIAKEQVMNSRKEAKVSATSIGLPSSHSLENVRLFDHLTPLLQQLLADSKKFQKRNGFKFCWAKNFVIYLRRTDDSRPIQIKCHN